MREIALAHARRGFKVFPLTAGAKKPPLVADWQHVATSDAEQVNAWWSRWPDANVGIHCDGLLVIDVDPKKGGFDSLAALEQEIFLEATYEVETPSGGRHLYYRCAGGVRNGVDVLGPGLDVRTTAGYVVAAGSSIGERGYRVVADEPIADADAAVVERCAARVHSDRERVVATVHTDADAAVVRAVHFLRTHPVAVQGQGGDHHTFRTVCRLRDFGVPRERVLEALEEWNARCSPPWSEEELAQKVDNAWAYAQDAAGKLTPEALGFERVAEPQGGADQPRIENDRSQIENEPRQRSELIHPSEVDLDSVLKAEYLIKGVLEKQSNAVLFGHWNVGKTFMVLDMAASIACGLEWFGRRVRQGRVLYLGYEGLRAMKKRMIALRDKYPLLKDAATPFEYAGLINPLVRPEGLQELGGVLKEFMTKHGGAPDLVIIDPLANALGGDDSDANLMGELNRCVAEIMKRQKCTVLRVHHSGHGNQDRARGHSSLPAGVDTEIRVTEGEIALSKQRDDVKSKALFKLTVVKIGRDVDGDEVSTCVITQVEGNPLDPTLNGPQQELLDALIKLRGDGGRVSVADVRNSVPDGTTPKERSKLVAELEKKQYLVPEGNKWVIAERGPMAIFD